MIYKCNLCPRECNVDRCNTLGACKANRNIKVALVSTHDFEEPCLSFKNGSGTIFFSNCNLKCVYCQNYKISKEGYGKEISIERLAQIFLEQQARGVNNINLVSPTIYVDKIISAIKIAKKNGLTIPIVYNSSGYEKKETIKKLNGFIDIYLPDFKYASNKLSLKYSGVNHYVENAKESIAEMIAQVGLPKFNSEGILTQGVIIRHLILPNNILNTKLVLKILSDNFKDTALISIMSQYFPTCNASNYPEISRKITKAELNEVLAYIQKLDIQNGYIQDLESNNDEYVPNFNLNNVESSN